jgi:hypothetical protein
VPTVRKVNETLCFTDGFKMSDRDKSKQSDTFRTGSEVVDHSVLRDRLVSVLNQSRAQKLDVTVHKLKSMSINSEEKLQTLVKTIFEKSVNDTQNSEAYTKLCERLSAFQVRSVESQYVCFKNLLENHCRRGLQTCFSTNESDSSQLHQKIDAIGFWSPDQE